MIKCPNCREDFNDVKNSRSTLNGAAVWRRRYCRKCDSIFTTHENVRLDFLKVKKKSGKKERYKRIKLYIGVHSAMLKTPKKEEAVERIIDLVEQRLLDLKKNEISVDEISDVVLKVIKKKNPRTFLRFLAYNKNPKSTEDLSRLIKKYS